MFRVRSAPKPSKAELPRKPDDFELTVTEWPKQRVWHYTTFFADVDYANDTRIEGVVVPLGMEDLPTRADAILAGLASLQDEFGLERSVKLKLSHAMHLSDVVEAADALDAATAALLDYLQGWTDDKDALENAGAALSAFRKIRKTSTKGTV